VCSAVQVWPQNDYAVNMLRLRLFDRAFTGHVVTEVWKGGIPGSAMIWKGLAREPCRSESLDPEMAAS
jgi:hypothetical protein